MINDGNNNNNNNAAGRMPPAVHSATPADYGRMARISNFNRRHAQSLGTIATKASMEGDLSAAARAGDAAMVFAARATRAAAAAVLMAHDLQPPQVRESAVRAAVQTAEAARAFATAMEHLQIDESKPAIAATRAAADLALDAARGLDSKTVTIELAACAELCRQTDHQVGVADRYGALN